MNTNGERGEVFTAEELAALDNKLKENENGAQKLPESLSKENIQKLIADIPQEEQSEFERKGDEVFKTKKKRDNRLAIKVLAFAAAFAVVFTSLITVKPWRYTKSNIEKKNRPITVKTVEDYTEIETLFANYAASYQKALNSQNYNGFGLDYMKSADTAAVTAPAGTAVINEALPESANGNADGYSAAPSVTARADESDGSAGDDGEIPAYGKTNEQVEGVHEADIIKTDGKYIYAVLPSERQYDVYNSYWFGGIVYDEEAKTEDLPHIESTCAIAVAEVKSDGTLEKAGTVTIAPEPANSPIFSMYLREMYITGSRLTAIVSGDAYLDKIVREDPAEETEAETVTETADETETSAETEEPVQSETSSGPEPSVKPEEYESGLTVETTAAAPVSQSGDSTEKTDEVKTTPGYNPDKAALTPPETEAPEDADALPDIAYAGNCCYALPYNTKSVTMVITYDISDLENPVEVSRVYQDGGYVSSRNIGDSFVLITNYYVNLYMNTDAVVDNCVPKCGVGGENYSRVSNNDICIMEQVNNSSYIVTSLFDLKDPENTFKTEAVLGGGENVYCTENTLYITSSEYSYAKNIAEEVFGSGSTEVVTQIYKYDISGGDIKHLASATVAGFALDQFSIDEKDGYLRIATSTGNWGADVVNIVHVLDKDLKSVGTLGGIAKGEVIKAVRFSGNTAYVVTFEQTDPLFVIDLSNPKKPEITGELKLPGYSQYLHPIADNLLLGVGVDGDENGAINCRMKVSLFDVSDPKNPVEADKFVSEGYDTALSEGGGGSYSYCNVSSAAEYDHKAFCHDGENNIVYIPYEKHENSWVNYGNYESNYKETYGAYAFKIDTENKKILATTDYICSKDENSYNYNEIDRVTYIGDTVVCFSNSRHTLYGFNRQTAECISTVDFAAD